jgi:hypothetical protein
MTFVAIDFDGSYQTPPLPAGTYHVRTSTSDFIDEVYDDIRCEPTCGVTAGTPVVVTDGVDTSNIDFALESLGRIAGRVTEAGSEEALSASILVYDDTGSFVTGTGHDADGAYETRGLAGGIYFLRAVTSAAAGLEDQLYRDLGCDPDCDVTAGTPVGVSDGTTTGGIDFALEGCSLPSHQRIDDLLVTDVQTREACRTVEVGPNVAVTGSGNLVVRARRAVSFANGFAVEAGGRLAVEIDPAIGSD